MRKFIFLFLWSLVCLGQAGNQMVSFTAAQSLGFALNSGQSHVTSNQCMTKSEALAKYNLSTSAMDGYANNQLVPRSTWVSGVVSYAFGVNARGNLDGNGWFTTNEDAGCENNNIIATFYSASSTLGIGVTVYKDSNLTDLCFSTGNAHYLYASAGDFLFTLGSGSVITSTADCSAAVFYLHLFAAGTEFNGPDSCFLLDYNTTFYSNDEELVNGSVLYTDSSLTTPYNGLNLYRHEQFTGNSFKVNTEGVIIDTWFCQ